MNTVFGPQQRVITIRREKQYQSPYHSHPGPAWKWIYNSNATKDYECGDGQIRTFPIGGFDRIKSFENYLKHEFPGCKIIRDWENGNNAKPIRS